MEINTSILFDPEIFEENRLPSHSDHKTYLDKANNNDCETLFNDGWKGFYSDDYSSDLTRFIAKNENDGLVDVKVPLSVELQGFAKPQYSNTQYPFDGYNASEIGEAITTKNPCMVYVKDFAFEKNEDRVVIDFKGFETALYLFVNGKYVGYSENLYLDSEFDITDYLEKNNRITAFVFKLSSSSWILDQDFFRFHGLFRDVSIRRYKQNHVEDIELVDDVNLLDCSSDLKINLKGNLENVNLIATIKYQDEVITTVADFKNHSSLHFAKVHLWSSENPALYTFELEVYKDGIFVEKNVTTFGFKKVEIVDSIIYFNGKRLIINGINRHEWNQYEGRHVSQHDMKLDIDIFKRYNINAVRTCHYPNNSYFYELCDKYGIYMMDEACIESHGSWQNAKGYGVTVEKSIPGNRENWARICISRVLNMYERDKNHPSIFMYSLGNESGIGTMDRKMYKALKERNPKVIIHYEGTNLDENLFDVSDVHSRMYWNCEMTRKFISQHLDRPFIHCEYAHAMGNSLGNMDEYRLLIKELPTYQGGFIWDYVDQGLRVNVNGKEILCYGGDNLDKPNDANFCCNGVFSASRDLIKESPKAVAMKYYYQNYEFAIDKNKVSITNNCLFKSTKDVLFRLSIYQKGVLVFQEDYDFDIKPGKTCSFEYEYDFTNVDTIVTISAFENVITPLKEEVMEVAYQEEQFNFYQETKRKHYPIEVIDGGYNLGVKVGGLSLLFSKAKFVENSSGLISLKINDEEYLSKVALPTIFRPATDNDIGNMFAYENALALSYSKYIYALYPDFSFKQNKKEVIVYYDYHLGMYGGLIKMEYHIYDNARIKVCLKLDSVKNLKSLPLFGYRMPLDKSKKYFTAFGLDTESYPDRMNGKTCIYHSNVEDEMYSYIRPQECGNHMNNRFVEIEGEKSCLKVTCDKKYFAFKYLPYNEFEIENANHQEELPNSLINYLTIIGFVRGVGGDDSWGARVHSQYELPTNHKYSFSFYIEAK